MLGRVPSKKNHPNDFLRSCCPVGRLGRNVANARRARLGESLSRRRDGACLSRTGNNSEMSQTPISGRQTMYKRTDWCLTHPQRCGKSKERSARRICRNLVGTCAGFPGPWPKQRPGRRAGFACGWKRRFVSTASLGVFSMAKVCAVGSFCGCSADVRTPSINRSRASSACEAVWPVCTRRRTARQDGQDSQRRVA